MSHVIVVPQVCIQRNFSSSSCFFMTSELRADFASPHRSSFIFSSRPSVLTVRVLSAVPQLRVCGVGCVPLPAPLICHCRRAGGGGGALPKGNVAVRVGTRNPLANKRPFWPFWGTGRCFLPRLAGGRGVRVLGGVLISKMVVGVGFVGKRGCGE